jgi:hypothetical protein
MADGIILMFISNRGRPMNLGKNHLAEVHRDPISHYFFILKALEVHMADDIVPCGG